MASAIRFAKRSTPDAANWTIWLKRDVIRSASALPIRGDCRRHGVHDRSGHAHYEPLALKTLRRSLLFADRQRIRLNVREDFTPADFVARGQQHENGKFKRSLRRRIEGSYSAEKQLIKALPKMAKAATSEDLQQGFLNHLEQTKGHAERLEQVFELLGMKPKAKTCKAMEGLIDEGKELLEEDADPEVLDAGLIAAAQRVEHYEIAGYGRVRTYAELLGEQEAMELLQQTLDEEAETDKKLTQLSERINVEAEHNDSADGEEAEKCKPARSGGKKNKRSPARACNDQPARYLAGNGKTSGTVAVSPCRDATEAPAVYQGLSTLASRGWSAAAGWPPRRFSSTATPPTSGSRTTNSHPCPGPSLCAVIMPLCNSMIGRTADMLMLSPPRSRGGVPSSEAPACEILARASAESPTPVSLTLSSAYAVSFLHAQPDLPARIGRANGIVQQVVDDAFQSRGVGCDHHRAFRERDVQFTP